MGACFQAPRAAPGQDRWKHFSFFFGLKADESFV